MQTQDLSYKLNNENIQIDIDGAKPSVSLEIFSFENVYTIEEYTISANNTYSAKGIVWGNTEQVDGSASVEINKKADRTSIKAKATLDRDIRCVKVRFDDLPLGTLVNMIDENRQVTEHGANYNYPEGWRSMSVPLLVFELNEGGYLYLRCVDKTVNAKRFFVKKSSQNTMRIDVVQEQDALELSHSYDVPEVEIAITNDLSAIYEEQSNIMKETYKLDEWADIKIAPSWMKDISLVVIMHMQAFTGYRFHTYKSAADDVEKLAKHIDGKHILVYLTGWEGRYYYKYGNYTPDERMGGEQELKKAVDRMHALGCKVMAMYGINFVNRNLTELKDVIQESEVVLSGGGRYTHGSVDWDGSHHYSFDDFATLNIGNKAWADNLFEQIKRNSLQFDFDGAFLDIAAAYYNDRRARMYDGVVAFCDRLRTIKKDFLVAGEGYYDGLSKAMPLFQSGHTEGKMHYHDRVDERLFTRFSREFAHLCLGDLSRGSTGVHEQGTNTDTVVPLRKGIIPTLTLVEDTLDKSMDKVVEILQMANKYYEEYNA